MTRAFLVTVYKTPAPKEEALDHLKELALLVETFGAEVVGQFPCQVRKFEAATLITEGKIEEILTLADQAEADLIVMDDEISPGQQRNLEEIFKRPVMDRTGVILEVFAQRAKTREARLQIELAKVKYQAPRLKRLWSHLSRQGGSAGGGGGGGGGYLKGEGEKQIEIDRRLLKERVEVLEGEIKQVKLAREQQRQARVRSEIPTFAIVGYTNAGKSTLMNALTEAGVFVEDKLFATLDTTTRKYVLPTNQEVLITDTVGFIRKLPHLLVAAFKSTLEEAVQTDILLHLIDASHPAAFEQAKATHEVLKELNAADKPIITVLNKVDQIQDPGILTRFRTLYPHTVPISALKREGFETLIHEMVTELAKQRKKITLRIPQSDYQIVSELMRIGHVIETTYEDNDVMIEVDLPRSHATRYTRYLVE